MSTAPNILFIVGRDNPPRSRKEVSMEKIGHYTAVFLAALIASLIESMLEYRLGLKGDGKRSR